MTSALKCIDDSPNLVEKPRLRGVLLIADDEEGPRESLRIIFKDEFELLLASNGPEAIKLAQENQIDVAIVDIRMGGMSGIEVLERLKYVDPAIEVVIMTAFETTDTMRQALRLRACDYINKPFDVSTMRAAVNNAMQRHTLDSEIDQNSEKLQQLVVELQHQQMKEEMSRARGDIYASIIHDINGPLSVISGYLQIINKRIGDSNTVSEDDVQFLKDRLKTITRQVTTCIDISRRYLHFLRKDEEGSPAVSFNQMLADLSQLARVHPSLQQNDFCTVPLQTDVGVRINGTDGMQLLLNLVVNAFQCTPHGHGVRVAANVLSEPLDLSRAKDSLSDRWMNIEGLNNVSPLIAASVSDNGPGIPTEVLPKVFEPYFTTKGPRQGTGLGLNIVLRLVKQAKGALHVRSVPGQGATFTVYLPAVRL